MLIHDRFVFLHVPKTGGRFVRQVLAETVPNCIPLPEERSNHFGWDKIPDTAAGRPVLAFVRNPWDWYVSWYSYLVSRPRERFEQSMVKRPLIGSLFAHGSNRSMQDARVSAQQVSDFATTVRRACTGIIDGGSREELERIADGSKLAGPLLEGSDFYTARLKATFGEGEESDLLTIGRFETLVDDLEAFLEKAGTRLPEGAGTKIRAMKPANASQRGHYREYYDDELRELVGASCKQLVGRFDYRF